MQQRTDEWFQAKLGKVGASRIHDIVGKTKTGDYGAGRRNYMSELVNERLTGMTTEYYVSRDMERGIEQEPLARAAYEGVTGILTEEVGFIEHPTIKNTGASPDGYVGDRGGMEIKSPKMATHIEVLLNKNIKARYYDQCQWGIECCQRDWWDFVSFDDRFPSNIQVYIMRYNRDDKRIEFLREEVTRFLNELDELEDKLRHLESPIHLEGVTVDLR